MIYKRLENTVRKTKTEEEWIEKLKKLDHPDYWDEEGFTPLGVSAYFGHLNACQYLVARGTNINFRNKYGESALHSAINSFNSHRQIHKLEETIEWLINTKATNIDAMDSNGDTCLMMALKNSNDTELAIKILKAGASINSFNSHGVTPLMLAASSRNEEFIKKTISKVRDINQKDYLGRTALYKLVENKKTSGYGFNVEKIDREKTLRLIPLFLKHASSLDVISSENGDTLLHRAAMNNYGNLVKACLKAGLNMNAKNSEGNTPLLLAIKHSSEESTNELLKNGADATIKNNENKDAYWYVLNHHKQYGQHPCDAVLKKYPFWETLLKQQNPTSENGETLLQIVEQGSIDVLKELVKRLLKKGVSIDYADKYGKTALMLACQKASAEKVSILLQAGANINLQDKYQKMALHYLMDNNYYGEDDRKTFDLLMNTPGINVNLQNQVGMTALMFACKVTLVDHHFIKALLKKGADIHLKTSQGKTCIDFIKPYNIELKELLKHHSLKNEVK